jgi:hypothetical protein
VIHSGNATVNRREERLLRERLAAMDGKVNALMEMAREVAAKPSPPPTFSDSDVAEVGRMLVEGRIKLPCYTRLTVTTTIEEITSKVFGTYDVITHQADQLHTKLLRPLTVLECLEAGIIRRIPNGWAWSEVAYERMAANG